MQTRPRIPKSLIQWHVQHDKSKVKIAADNRGVIIHQLTKATLMTDKGTFPLGRFLMNFEFDNPFNHDYIMDLDNWKNNTPLLDWDPNTPFRPINHQLHHLCESWWLMMPKYYDKLQVHQNCSFWLDYVKLHNNLILYLKRHQFFIQVDFTSNLMKDMLTWVHLVPEHFPQIPIFGNSVMVTNQFFVGPSLGQAYQTKKAHKYRIQQPSIIWPLQFNKDHNVRCSTELLGSQLEEGGDYFKNQRAYERGTKDA